MTSIFVVVYIPKYFPTIKNRLFWRFGPVNTWRQFVLHFDQALDLRCFSGKHETFGDESTVCASPVSQRSLYLLRASCQLTQLLFLPS